MESALCGDCVLCVFIFERDGDPDIIHLYHCPDFVYIFKLGKPCGLLALTDVYQARKNLTITSCFYYTCVHFSMKKKSR